MKNYFNEINSNFSVRRSEKQKKTFQQYTRLELSKYNIKVENETLNDKHTNIIIGDIDKADVIFTAHYDTPAASVFPNIMFPRNKLLSYLYVLFYCFIIVGFAFCFAFLIKHFISFDDRILIGVYLVIYLLLFYLCTRCFKNKNNYNDNTSGVSVIFEIIQRCNKPNVAYILFDNEEKGKLGSKAYNKKYKDRLKGKLIINMDCVGNGNNIIMISKPTAQKHPLHSLFDKSFISKDIFKFYSFGMKGSNSNTDFMNFDCSVTFMASKKCKIIGFYTPYIHTSLDVKVNDENIQYLSSSFINFINMIN